MLAIPVIGSVIEVYMGYEGGPSAFRGRYLIDQITVGSPAQKMTVTGGAADLPGSYRTPQTKSYHQKTIGEIMEEIAGRSGYQANVDPEVAGIVIRHIDQHNESDMSFAKRLAEMHDAVAKPVAGRLAVAKRGTGKSIDGRELPPVMLVEADCAQWQFHYSAREESGKAGGLDGAGGGSDQKAAGDAGASQLEQFQDDAGLGPIGPGPAPGQSGGVRAFWHDIRTGEKKEVTSGREPYHDLRHTFHNEAEATAAVDAAKNKADRGKASFSCLIGGRPSVQAEAKLILAPPFRPYIPAAWRIKSCAHRLDGSGYTTTINAELFEEKQADVPGKVGKTKPSGDDTIDPDAPVAPVKAPPAPSGGGDIIQLPD